MDIKRKQDRKEIEEIRETINAIRRASGKAIIELDGKVKSRFIIDINPTVKSITDNKIGEPVKKPASSINK